MDVTITEGRDIRALLDECGPPVWMGKGAEALGLSGTAERADVERVFTGPEPEDEGEAAIWRLRRDGLL
jgi:hypothetical protein